MKKILSLFTLFALLVQGAASCEKEPGNEEGPAKAVQMNISFDKALNTDAGIVARTWQRGDKVGVYNTQSSAVEASVAVPLSYSGFSSLFTVGLTNVSNGAGLLGYFPAEADVKYADGMIKTQIPAAQNGQISPVYIGKATYNESVVNMTLAPFYTVVYAQVNMGNYSIVKAVFKGNANEKIAGAVNIKYDDFKVEATESAVTVENSKGYDCRSRAVRIPFVIAPVSLASGYTITCTTDAGEEIVISTKEAVECTMGGRIDAGESEDGEKTQLLFCGDNMIYLIDAQKAIDEGYKKAILWQWDAKSEATRMGMTEANMIRLDDCKLVDNNTKVLATSSKSYAVLLDFKTQKLLWYSTGSKNAHSAEILPNNRIAVACSEGGDVVQIFDIDSPNTVLFSTELPYAHGVVWNPANQRLYACGDLRIHEYSLTDWDTNSPKLTLEKSISSYPHVTGLHDMTLIDDNTLLVAGKYAAFYDIQKNAFTKLPHFEKSSGIKSVNYNPQTGECWYTDATNSGRELTWSSNDIRFTYDLTKTNIDASIWIGDLNMYKVRVYHW
ncbi:MAG: WD40 repeat domain-containing protein [Bacteroidales bacterium]|nr:WD40 repeat domain-containing protein [Bacteroidales bacterium]